MPYAQYLQERFFGPLGLGSTSYCGYEGRDVPVGYATGEHGLTTTRLSDMEFPGAAGGLCSTVEDLLDWQRALVTGGVVGAESYERMTTPASLESGEPMTYGYGLGVGDLEVRVFEEDGALMAQATNQRALHMKYQGEHTFVLDAPQSIKLVFELDGDRASAVTLHQSDAVTRAPRVEGTL